MYNRIKIGHNCKQFFISLQERTDAKALFKTKKGKEQLHEIETMLSKWMRMSKQKRYRQKNAFSFMKEAK